MTADDDTPANRSGMMTEAEIKALLAGLGSADEAWTYDPEDSKVREGSGHEICWDSTDADGAMIAAAPDLARTCLSLFQQLADAQAAQAAFVQRAVAACSEVHTTGRVHGPQGIAAAIRALAPDTGVKALAEMREEQDRIERIGKEYCAWMNEEKARADKFEAESTTAVSISCWTSTTTPTPFRLWRLTPHPAQPTTRFWHSTFARLRWVPANDLLPSLTRAGRTSADPMPRS